MPFDTLFQQASSQSGKHYLVTEEKLRRGGNSALATLKIHQNDSDEVDRLMAKCLVDWMEGRAPDNQTALDYMQGLPVRMARTPIGIPSPPGLANYLKEHFGPRVAELVALRMAKETEWPTWKVFGVLLYLDDVKVDSTNGAIIRFAAETKNSELRNAALSVLKRSPDPNLGAKLRAEKNRANSRQSEFPDSLDSLISRK